MLKEGRYKTIKPILTYPHFFSYEDVQEMDYMGRCKERYSDLPDEVQVKDKINLINLIGISLPIMHNINNKKLNIEEAYKYLCLLERTLKENDRKIGVYDLEIQEEINSDNFVKIYKK